MAGRLDDREVVAVALRGRENGATAELGGTVANSLRGAGGGGSREHVLAPTLRVGPQRPQDGGPGDTVPIIAATLNSGGNDGGFRTEPGEHLVAYRKSARRSVTDNEMLPLGLDSHRYRCCGNGVVAPVSEWIGHRLRRAFDERAEVAA
jgi:DNA (cytosine-5)-methyltransferase 1